MTRRHSPSLADAEEAAQEAAIRVWRFRDRCARPDEPAAWVAAIARREAFRVAAGSRGQDLRADVVPLEEELDFDPVERLAVSAAVAALDPRDSELLKLRYEEDLTQPAIAARLGMAEGTVKVRLHRARAKLRQTLEAG